jgi:hypothetical protein
MRLLIAAIAVLAATISLARDNGQYSQSDPEIKKWIEQLKNNRGESCCSNADGYDVQYDTKDGHYRVYLHDEWHVVPDYAVLTTPNRLGAARVWYMSTWTVPDKDGKQKASVRIYCFLPSALY